MLGTGRSVGGAVGGAARRVEEAEDVTFADVRYFVALKPWAVLREGWQLSPSRLSALVLDDRPNVR